MTEKQEKILESALALFAEQGFAATSTSKVAKQAGVSEGLIFRHFENKEGLLNAILQRAHEKVGVIFNRLTSLKDPKEMLRQIIQWPFNLTEDEKLFWKLLYALKWQAETYDDSVSAPTKLLLSKAFESLGYQDANAQAEVLMIIMDGLATSILLRQPANLEQIKLAILKKYGL